ncbi:MAG TPA: hypothetical protein VFI27_02375 [candidate division Zixibacteria bacterium]|nr:hypothetical protein [candidate division Zixibacteria bacterium]
MSNNSSSDWAAVARAIWYFQTFTRGWGDIGYNYLVDMNGALYEGHLGGDDVCWHCVTSETVGQIDS